ncbi:hypothetical protein HanPSC8_Chr02g0082981 [Helianthus annuus]|nr:hypothetical protein HanPSC8_Chr02g0082981 [Helianthus annuus]
MYQTSRVTFLAKRILVKHVKGSIWVKKVFTSLQNGFIKKKAKLHFSSFMFQGFCRRCPLSLKITLYVLYVCNL